MSKACRCGCIVTAVADLPCRCPRVRSKSLESGSYAAYNRLTTISYEIFRNCAVRDTRIMQDVQTYSEPLLHMVMKSQPLGQAHAKPRYISHIAYHLFIDLTRGTILRICGTIQRQHRSLAFFVYCCQSHQGGFAQRCCTVLLFLQLGDRHNRAARYR